MLLFTSVRVDIKELSWSLSDGCSAHKVDVHILMTPTLQMRDILKTEELEIPEGVTVAVKSRVIVVTGPRGKLTKNIRHINMDVRLVKGKSSNKVTLAVWQGNRKHVACLRTVKSLISNMITGVTKVSTPLCIPCNDSSPRVGFPLQNASSICPLPDQLHHPGQWTQARDQEFSGGEGTVHSSVSSNYSTDGFALV